MKKMLICAILLVGCNLYAQQPKGVYYEIFVRSFNDANGDGIGDIPGITQKLDYLKGLGISGLWLTPIHPSPTYHKYDVINYKAIDPEYGTLADYKTLVQEAHKRGMKILLDLVVNHTSSEHPWFAASTRNEAPFENYYVWKFDTTKQKEWYSNPKNPQEKYYAFFWERMPDLNFDLPEVRKEIIEVGKFWLTEVGIDGYRLDAAQHVYDADDVVKNNEWWTQFRAELRQVKPDVFLIGEVWNRDSVVASYLKSSLDACFNFDLSRAITDAITEGSASGFVEKLARIHQLYASYNPQFVDATFVSNHDQDRYRSTFNGDEAKTKQAFMLLMTLPGLPFLYYGEEIGMLGKFPDEYRREPFLWTEINSTNTSWEQPRYSNAQTVAPLSLQQQQANSFYQFYKAAIALRNNNPILAQGKLALTKLVEADKRLIAFELVDGKKRVLILHNVSNEPLLLKVGKYKSVLFGNGFNAGKSVNLSGHGSVVLVL
ncbi:MAG: alpha-amylase [Bacteroidetes bacterium]|nr:MAG: alpha-amylase [Bacteroidota bacterium]